MTNTTKKGKRDQSHHKMTGEELRQWQMLGTRSRTYADQRKKASKEGAKGGHAKWSNHQD